MSDVFSRTSKTLHISPRAVFWLECYTTNRTWRNVVFPLVFQWFRWDSQFVVHLESLIFLTFSTVFEVTMSSPRGCPCPPPRAAGNERCAHGETLVLPRFFNGFVGIPSPGTRRGGTRARGHAFVVHLEMLILLVFTRFFNCFRGNHVLIPPRPRGHPGAPL